MKRLALGVIIIAIALMTGCNSKGGGNSGNTSEPETINELIEEVFNPPILPLDMHGLTFEIVINEAFGFFKSEESYFIHFGEYQNLYNISNEFEISSGSYEFISEDGVIALAIDDSRFWQGTMTFTFKSDLEGDFNISTAVTNHNPHNENADHIAEFQNGTFKIHVDGDIE